VKGALWPQLFFFLCKLFSFLIVVNDNFQNRFLPRPIADCPGNTASVSFPTSQTHLFLRQEAPLHDQAASNEARGNLKIHKIQSAATRLRSAQLLGHSYSNFPLSPSHSRQDWAKYCFSLSQTHETVQGHAGFLQQEPKPGANKLALLRSLFQTSKIVQGFDHRVQNTADR